MSRSALTAALAADEAHADFALSQRRLPSAQVEDVPGTLEAAMMSTSLNAASNYLSVTPSSLAKASVFRVTFPACTRQLRGLLQPTSASASAPASAAGACSGTALWGRRGALAQGGAPRVAA
jgi:hypothetical protein